MSRKMTMRTRAILLVAVFMLVMDIGLGEALKAQTRGNMKLMIDERMLDIVNTAADMLDGDALSAVTADDTASPDFMKLYDTLKVFQDNTSLRFIYAARETEDGQVILIVDPAEEETGEFGMPLVETPALRLALSGEASVDAKPYTDSFGRFYSAYSPIYNKAGQVAGIVAADFDVNWYERELEQDTMTVNIACIVFFLVSIAIVVVLTGQFDRQMKEISRNVTDLAEDLISLTKTFDRDEQNRPKISGGGIQNLGLRIAYLRNDLREYISHSQTQANNMITAMASDYRVVYHVNLDEDDAICYRTDHTDPTIHEGDHFSYLDRITWHAENIVTEGYREGFLHFVDPDTIRAALATEPIIAYRYLARSEDGHEYYEMIRMAGVRRAEDRDDHIVHSIGLGFTEIDAEMREAMARNEALVLALTAAEEASKAKTSFLSSMSHEIRTPMNAIIGLDTLALHDKDLPAQTREYLTKIGDSARHLLALINDILDMSRIESGRLVLRSEEFSFNGVLDQINTMVMSQCNDKGLQYVCRILSPVDAAYIGDDMKLKEVLINILSNAIKFTSAPGSVTLTVERTAVFEDQSTLRFTIADTGIGIDKEFLPKIFEPFSQEDSTTKNKYGSSGLGMAITRSIVEMMNGTISVESEKGVGSTFTVVVTLRNAPHRDEAAPENAIDPHRLRVLVADSDAVAAEHARVVLDEVGIRADICASGAEALRMLDVQRTKQAPYSLVLVDLDLPGNGLETTRQIRQQVAGENTVVLLTAYHWDDIRHEAESAGVDGFLTKPLFAANILDEFSFALRRSARSLFQEKKRADLTGRRVLLADDMEINAEIMIDVLDMREVLADHAENGRVAVEMFSQNPPGTYAAILMDVRMPEMDGLEATAAIRALDRPDAKRIPIIALTANAFDEDVQRSLQAGMNAHLTKPIEPDHLYQTLEELIYEAEK